MWSALEADLKRVPLGECIVIGTATDPYQPAERKFKITRAVLQRLTRCEGLSFGIITKSPLIARDCDLLLRSRSATSSRSTSHLSRPTPRWRASSRRAPPFLPRACAPWGSSWMRA